MFDAEGCYVIVGGIDPHTYQLKFIGQVSIDNFYIVSRAALSGGPTMVGREFYDGRSRILCYHSIFVWCMGGEDFASSYL